MSATILRGVRHTWIGCGLVLALVGCGDVRDEGAQPRAQEQCEETAGGETTADELSELLAELLAPRISAQVRGTFIGLPGEVSNDGPAGGRDPSVGRWWIRECSSDVRQGQLHISIGGNGWTWLDRESTGFRVRQYLRFDASAELTASLHVGYDARARIATIWLRPAPGVAAQVQPRGLVRAEATGVFSSILGGILDLTGSSASDRARAQAAEEGSQRLRERMQVGFTVTYQLDAEQMDFMLGALERGQIPERPWPNGEIPWLYNQRSSVWPGGLDVLGPIGPSAGDVTLDVELEEGEGATLRRVCQDDLGRFLDAAMTSSPAQPPSGDSVIELHAARSPRTVRLASGSCPGMLLITPTAQASLPVTLRYRVTPIVGSSAGAAGVASGGGASGGARPVTGVVPSGPSAVRLQIASVSVRSISPSGSSWDVVGGQADLYVVVHSIPRSRVVDRTPALADVTEGRFDRWAPGALRMEDFPLRIVVYDEDVTDDEVIGVADLEASAIGSTEREVVLDLRSEGSSPVQTGTVRLRLAPLR